jgi:hypothetical protein
MSASDKLACWHLNFAAGCLNLFGVVAWMKQPTAAGTLACDGVSGGIFLVLAPLGLISTAFGWRQPAIQAISDLHQSQD